MRRPLFGNGIPKNILNPDGQVLILDTGALDRGTVYALTLYAWVWKSAFANAAATEPDLGLTLTTSGGSPESLAAYFATFFEAWKDSVKPQKIAPIKVLDRFLMRGDQQVHAGNANALSTSCFLYGYFEAMGEVPIGEPYRPLQPGALVAPYSPVPVHVQPAGAGATEYKTAHKLDAAYLDQIILDVTYFKIAVPDLDIGSAFIRLPGGIKMPLATPGDGDGIETGALTSRVFDGIPMKASDDGNLIEVGFETNGAVGDASALTAFGNFRRY